MTINVYVTKTRSWLEIEIDKESNQSICELFDFENDKRVQEQQ